MCKPFKRNRLCKNLHDLSNCFIPWVGTISTHFCDSFTKKRHRPECCQVAWVEDDPIPHLWCEERLQHVEHHVEHPENFTIYKMITLCSETLAHEEHESVSYRAGSWHWKSLPVKTIHPNPCFGQNLLNLDIATFLTIFLPSSSPIALRCLNPKPDASVILTIPAIWEGINFSQS